MSTKELERKITTLQEWEALAKEAAAEADKLKDELKAEMSDRETQELCAGRWIVRWTAVIRNNFDSTAFKKLYPEVYHQFTRPVQTSRFSVTKA